MNSSLCLLRAVHVWRTPPYRTATFIGTQIQTEIEQLITAFLDIYLTDWLRALHCQRAPPCELTDLSQRHVSTHITRMDPGARTGVKQHTILFGHGLMGPTR
jgi:hypothetical protein